MAKTIMVELRPEDAEPILRRAAYEAAKYGAWVDYIDRRTYNPPSSPTAENRKRWQDWFLRAKRTVEGFGIEYEQTSEAETLTTHIPDKVLKSHIVNIGGIRFRHVDESVPDPKNIMPAYRGEVHSQACHAAADRVVRAWQATIELAKAA